MTEATRAQNVEELRCRALADADRQEWERAHPPICPPLAARRVGVLEMLPYAPPAAPLDWRGGGFDAAGLRRD